jgi:hypothetical protein
MTTQTAQHTPTPWTLEECIIGGKLIVRGRAGKHPQSHIQVVPSEDAAYIVQCVNSHAALVEALHHVIETWDSPIEEYPSAVRDVIKHVQAALRLAGSP